MRLILPLLLLSGVSHARNTPIVLTEFRTQNAETWERAHRKSESRPLTVAELEKLAKAGIGKKTLNEMMRTRGVLALADADTMLKLKAAGASDESIAALSAYAVKPNDGFQLRIDVDLSSPDTVRAAPYLYVEVWHLEKNQQEAFYYTDLRGKITRGDADVVRDDTDPLLPETLASLSYFTTVDTRQAGKMMLKVAISQKAGLQSLADLPPKAQSRIKTFEFSYPAVSLDNRCALSIALRRDAVFTDMYDVERSDLQCHWD